MNRKQRLRNKATAQKLERSNRARQVCPECGEVVGEGGGHWITTRATTLEDIIGAERSGKELNQDDYGFWCCAKFYGEDGVRLPQYRIAALDPTRMFGTAMGELLGMIAAGEGPDPKHWGQPIMFGNPGGSSSKHLWDLTNGLPGTRTVDLLPTPFTERDIDEFLGIKTPEQKAFMDRLQDDLVQQVVAGSTPGFSCPNLTDVDTSDPAFRLAIAQPIVSLVSAQPGVDTTNRT